MKQEPETLNAMLLSPQVIGCGYKAHTQSWVFFLAIRVQKCNEDKVQIIVGVISLLARFYTRARTVNIGG